MMAGRGARRTKQNDTPPAPAIFETRRDRGRTGGAQQTVFNYKKTNKRQTPALSVNSSASPTPRTIRLFLILIFLRIGVWCVFFWPFCRAPPLLTGGAQPRSYVLPKDSFFSVARNSRSKIFVTTFVYLSYVVPKDSFSSVARNSRSKIFVTTVVCLCALVNNGGDGQTYIYLYISCSSVSA